jgi:ferritin
VIIEALNKSLDISDLHQNFYENWFVPEQVNEGIEDVKSLLEKLRALPESE